jgi:hypothetical protein
LFPIGFGSNSYLVIQHDDYIRTINIHTTSRDDYGTKHTIEARAKLDTGCDVSIACASLVRRLCVPLQPLSDSDPKISQLDGSSFALVGKVTLRWYGENPQYPRLRFLFGPQTCISDFYVPESPNSPFDVIIGRDLINEYHLDQCKCLGGYSSGQHANDSYTLLKLKRERELRRMSKEEREANCRSREDYLFHQQLLREEEERNLDRKREEQRLQNDNAN